MLHLLSIKLFGLISHIFYIYQSCDCSFYLELVFSPICENSNFLIVLYLFFVFFDSFFSNLGHNHWLHLLLLQLLYIVDVFYFLIVQNLFQILDLLDKIIHQKIIYYLIIKSHKYLYPLLLAISASTFPKSPYGPILQYSISISLILSYLLHYKP